MPRARRIQSASSRPQGEQDFALPLTRWCPACGAKTYEKCFGWSGRVVEPNGEIDISGMYKKYRKTFHSRR